MTEADYLKTINEIQDRRWPAGLDRAPQYPLGDIPLTGYLRHWANVQPDKAVVNFYGAELSFRQLDDLSGQFATLLQNLGVNKGDRVAVFMPNCPQFLIAFYGILKLGAVHVPVNPMFKQAELLYEVNDTGARVIVVLDQLTDVVQDVMAQTEIAHVLTTSLGEMAPDNPVIPAPPGLGDVAQGMPGAIDMLGALDGLSPLSARSDEDPDDIAALNYTGGTTGLPKGCIHTQRDMVYTAATTVPLSLGLERDDTYLCMLPVFWVAGEVFGVIFPVFSGATVVLLARWDAIATMAAIERFGVTHASFMVDGVVEMSNHPDVGQYDLRSLKRTGGISFVKKLNPEFRSKWQKLTGSQLREVAWGMTETHTCDTMNYGFDEDDFDLTSRPVFVGMPVPGTEFKICDFDTGALMPLGQEGEICVRTPSLLKGYWNRPDETNAALKDGWLHTGDIGMYSEQGFLHFLGRRKEMLKVNGMSVFPSELEALLGQYPGLQGSGVIGRPDDQKGEVPVAFVCLESGQRNEAGQAEFIRWLHKAISSYKRPEIRFVDALPMTETGKVKKSELDSLI